MMCRYAHIRSPNADWWWPAYIRGSSVGGIVIGASLTAWVIAPRIVTQSSNVQRYVTAAFGGALVVALCMGAVGVLTSYVLVRSLFEVKQQRVSDNGDEALRMEAATDQMNCIDTFQDATIDDEDT